MTGNLTVVAPTSAGYLYIGPVATSSPPSSSLNVPKGDIRAASVTVKLDGSSKLGVVWRGSVGAKADVWSRSGYLVKARTAHLYPTRRGAGAGLARGERPTGLPRET